MISQWPITIINLGGLTLAIGIVIMILLFVRDQFSYNKFNEKRDRIYLVQLGSTEHLPAAIGFDLKENFEDIEQVVRFTTWGDGLVEYPLSGEESQSYILENPVYTDSTIFDVFSFSFIAGDPETALKAPCSAVLTEDVADMIFPFENPVGEVIRVENNTEYTVTGVIENVHNFHIPIDAIFSFNPVTKMFGGDSRYDDGWQHPTYVLLPEKHNTSQVEGQIEEFYKERKIFEDPDFLLNSLNKIYFTSRVGKKGNLQFVYLLLSVGILIVIIATLNYINLTTAGSGQRFIEVGIKKVIGGDPGSLLVQFLTESVLLTLIALFLGFEPIAPGSGYGHRFPCRRLYKPHKRPAFRHLSIVPPFLPHRIRHHPDGRISPKRQLLSSRRTSSLSFQCQRMTYRGSTPATAGTSRTSL